MSNEQGAMKNEGMIAEYALAFFFFLSLRSNI
jgi:hypothetical protein